MSLSDNKIGTLHVLGRTRIKQQQHNIGSSLIGIGFFERSLQSCVVYVRC